MSQSDSNLVFTTSAKREEITEGPAKSFKCPKLNTDPNELTDHFQFNTRSINQSPPKKRTLRWLKMKQKRLMTQCLRHVVLLSQKVQNLKTVPNSRELLRLLSPV
jgi:hypothetical protein